MSDDNGNMPFLDHLEELRWRIIWSVLFAVIGSVVGIVLVVKADVMTLLLHPLNVALAQLPAASDAIATGLVPPSGRLHFLSLTEPFMFVITMGMGTGLLLLSPLIIYQGWAFLSPALERHEKRIIIPSLYFGVLMFVIGVAVAYFLALPASIGFLLEFGSEYFTPMLTAGYYLSFVLGVLLAFGVLFEMPVVIAILAGLGLVTPAFLRAKRRHAYVLLTVVAALVSPGDMITVTAMLLVPLVLLYEISVTVAAWIYNRRMGPGRGTDLIDPLAVWVVLGGMGAHRRAAAGR